MTEAEWLASDDPVRMLSWLTERTDLGEKTTDHPSDRKLRLFACEWYTRMFPLGHEVLPVVEAVRKWAEGEITKEEAMDAPGLGKGARQQWYLFRGLPACLRRLANLRLCSPHTKAGVAALLREICGNPRRPVMPFAVAYEEAFGDDRECRCGHPYYRHFDTYEDMRPVGCKYCQCSRFFPGDWLAWNDGLVPKLARAIYDDRAFDRLPELADALWEAGCDDESLLRHLRGMEECFNRAAGAQRDVRLAKIPVGGCRCAYCQDGWIPLRGPHARGCWAVDLLLGLE